MRERERIFKKYPVVLLQMVRLIKDSAQSVGFTEESGERLAFEVVSKLKKVWGGKQIYFAKRCKKSLVFFSDVRREVVCAAEKEGACVTLTVTLGEKVVKKLLAHYTGERLYLPKAESFEVTRRNEYILREFHRVGVEELADKFGLSSRRIYQIVTAAKTKGEEL